VTIVLNITGSTGIINWQYAEVNGLFSTINNTNLSSYTATINETTTFRVFSETSGCADTSEILQITVRESPIASFTYDQQLISYTVNFTNASNYSTEFRWDFGSGFIDEGTNPVFIFPFDGTYLVRLIADNGCSQDTFELEIIMLKIVGIDELNHYELSVHNG